jgi:hypothetical protein
VYACGVFREVFHIDIQRPNWEDILFIHSIFSDNTFFFNAKEKKKNRVIDGV